MLIVKDKKIKGMIITFIIMLIPLLFNSFPRISQDNNINSIKDTSIKNEELNFSVPPTTYDWWNNSWNFRVPVSIEASGNQQDAPVELFINFTKYFKDLNIQNPELNTSTIRVIEYLSSSNYYEVESQFDLYLRSYNNQTNAIGDLIWILNGTTLNGQTRDFFVYFNNGTNLDLPEPNYDIIRIWHEGFEEYRSGDILRPTDGQDNYHPTFWEISNITSARGSSSLHIWGNCWKMSATGSITVNSDTRVTARMRFDDPGIVREISGIGFDNSPNDIPSEYDSYNIRGLQTWGIAGDYKFRNQYYATNTFFWYTFIPSTEITLSTFTHIVYIADDDPSPSPVTFLDLYWDDISIWNKPVQTTPNNSLQTTLGDIQPISYILKVSCKDEDMNPVPNALINITNDLSPSYDQDHETDENGEWIFEDIEKDAIYNITVNYTQNGLNNPKSAIVFYYENYPITQLTNQVSAYLNLSKFDFNIKDKDDDPIQYGFVLLKSGSETVGKTLLSDTGTGSITWINDTSYTYEVYFDYDFLPDNSIYRYPNLEIYSDNATTDNDVSTEITKIIFNVTDTTPEKLPFTMAKLRFYNSSDFDNEVEIIANVTVDINGIARFISFSDSYENWGNYTVDVYFGGSEQSFIANGTYPIIAGDGFEFILKSQDYASIEIDLNKDAWNSTITIIDYTSNFFWGEYGSIHFNFTKQDPIIPTPTKVTPDELYIQFFDQELTQYSEKINILSSEISTGVFNYTFTCNDFNLLGGTTYYFNIIGNYKNYLFNSIGYKPLILQAIGTDIEYYDYSLNPLTNKRISVIYREIVNITVDYFDINTGNTLPGALITYEWDYGSGILNNDPLHANLYYFGFDSTPTPNVAEYIIDITATLTNYSTIIDSIIIDVLPRPTSINGTTSLFQISPKIYVFDVVNYMFEYKDSLQDIRLGDLDIVSYNWFRLDENGNPLSGPGNQGNGDLASGANNIYILDFDTEFREIGEYSLFITMQKNNYEVRNAFISLTINKRPITMDLSATGLSGNRINVVQGRTINFSIVLTDETEGIQLLSGANITLRVEGKDYSVDEIPGSPGTYKLEFHTNNINAFFMPQTLTGQITVELENYEINITSLTIIVGMIEIFPGVPMFYFLLMLGSVVAIGGSLISYHFIQRARIPTFVKRIREMKKNIKGKKSISVSLLYPTKDKYIVKKLGENWEKIGLSLADIIDVKGKRSKRLPELKEKFKGGVD